MGTTTAGCTRGHVNGGRHFKSKFCTRCKASMIVPERRVRCLDDDLEARFRNNHASGFWTQASVGGDSFRYRIINNTNGCTLPLIIVFEDEPPKHVEWPQLPENLRSGDGYLQMCVSKGTAVPVKTLQYPHLKPLLPRGDDSVVVEELPAVEDLPVVDADLPVVCDVLVPSVVMKLSQPEPPSPPPELTASDLPESDHEKRVRRNRESAAKSRRTKCEYIAMLEDNIGELSRTVDELVMENWRLQALCAVDEEEALRYVLEKFERAVS